MEVEKKCVCVSFFLLFPGSCSFIIEPRPKNTSVGEGTRNVTFYCASDLGAMLISWSFTPDDTNSSIMIAQGKVVRDIAYQIFFSSDHQTTNLVIKQAITFLAGVYSCNDGHAEAQATLTVVSESPAKFNDRPIFIISGAALGLSLIHFTIGTVVCIYRCLKKKEVSASHDDVRTMNQEMTSIHGEELSPNRTTDLVENDCSPDRNQMQCAVNDEPKYSVSAKKQN